MAKNNFADAKSFTGRIVVVSRKLLPKAAKTQLRDFLNARIGGKGKLTATEVSDKGGIAFSYISELKNGDKDPLGMSIDALVRLARGMDESPVTLFKAAINKLEFGIRDEDLQQVLEDFAQLDNRARLEIEFVFEQLRRLIRERLDRNT